MIQQNLYTFSRHNRVHFVADIKVMTGDETSVQGESTGLFRNAAVIDINRNGEADVYAREDGSFVYFDVEEPAFISSYAALQQMARRNGTHIIRQEDVRPVKVGQPGYTINKWVFDRGSSGPRTTDVRTLDTVIDEIGAFPRDARWAIDTYSNRFVIYSPGRPNA
jgi:hypothetical protein